MHLLRIQSWVREHRPSGLVVDPASALLKAGDQIMTLSVIQRLLHLTKSEGITVVCTSLLDKSGIEKEATELQISTIADTWIHLSYGVHGGERNRLVSIIKSRGTKHSNQGRELILNDEGVTLADVYTAGGEVLVGTLRWEKERETRRERERVRRDLEWRRRSFELAEAEAEARIQALKPELELRRAELDLLADEQKEQEQQWAARRRELQRLRGTDAYHDDQSYSYVKLLSQNPTGISVPTEERMRLRLYVVGQAPNSLRAISNLRKICSEYLADQCQIEIVDVLQQPAEALADGILVTPTLIKLSPEPQVRAIGDLSDIHKVLMALGDESIQHEQEAFGSEGESSSS